MYTAGAYTLATAGKDVLFPMADQWWRELGYASCGGAVAHPLCEMLDIWGYVPRSNEEVDVVSYGKAAAGDAILIEQALTCAVKAYHRRDLAGALYALNAARSIEIEYGDTPATTSVADAILVYRTDADDLS